MIYFFTISIVSFLAIVFMVGVRVSALRRGKIIVDPAGSGMTVFVRQKIDYTAYVFVVACKELVRIISLKILLGFRRVMAWLRVLLSSIERRCGKVIDLVHGRHAVDQGGKVSVFLREITDQSGQNKSTK